METVCVYKTSNPTKADLIKAHLEGAGIPCYLRADNAGGTLPYLNLVNEIAVIVHYEDKERALKIVQGT